MIHTPITEALRKVRQTSLAYTMGIHKMLYC